VTDGVGVIPCFHGKVERRRTIVVESILKVCIRYYEVPVVSGYDPVLGDVEWDAPIFVGSLNALEEGAKEHRSKIEGLRGVEAMMHTDMQRQNVHG
jgi:hypothetical protein